MGPGQEGSGGTCPAWTGRHWNSVESVVPWSVPTSVRAQEAGFWSLAGVPPVSVSGPSASPANLEAAMVLVSVRDFLFAQTHGAAGRITPESGLPGRLPGLGPSETSGQAWDVGPGAGFVWAVWRPPAPAPPRQAVCSWWLTPQRLLDVGVAEGTAARAVW